MRKLTLLVIALVLTGQTRSLSAERLLAIRACVRNQVEGSASVVTSLYMIMIMVSEFFPDLIALKESAE